MRPKSSYTRTPIAARFWPKVDRRASDGCWPWLAARTGNGYGKISAGGRGPLLLAHRFAFELASGEPIPDGWLVCHTCDNPLCVRNDEAGTYVAGDVMHRRFGHLFLAPPAANTADMFRKQRGGYESARGERNAAAKLSASDVRAIRAHGATRYGDVVALARRYGVSTNSIGNILARRTWRSVE